MHCGLACVDLQTDPSHCGACGHACLTGGSCVAGSCVCAAGLTICGARCVRPGTDGPECGICRPGLRVCDGRCVNLRSDAQHCGACFARCRFEVESCIDGVCVCSETMLPSCGGRCIDTRMSDANCGACGRVCAADLRCVASRCIARYVWPPPGARVGNRRPTFRWRLDAGAVEICADPRCDTPLVTAEGNGLLGVRPTRPLSPGRHVWRTRYPDGATGPWNLLFVDARDLRAGDGALPSQPDLDGDGRGDVVVSTNADALMVVFGTDVGVSAPSLTAPTPLSGLTALRRYPHERTDRTQDVALIGSDLTLLGLDVRNTLVLRGALDVSTSLGDLNNDGFEDYLPTRTVPTVHFGSGVTRQVLSQPGLRSHPQGVLAGADVDNDGFLDLVMDAPDDTPPSVYVFFGGSAGITRSVSLRQPSPATGAGRELRWAGDVNGDGFADLLVGLGRAGALLYAGGPSPTLARTFAPLNEGELLVGAAGDVDADGFTDLAAVPRASAELWIYRGGVMGPSTTPVVVSNPLFSNVEVIGDPRDLNGDGFDDIVLADPRGARLLVIFGAAQLPLGGVVEIRPPGVVELGAHLY